MINEYLIDRKEKLKYEEEKNTYIFSLVVGLILCFSGVLNFLYSYKSLLYDFLCFTCSILGIIILFFTTANPNVLNKPYNFIKSITQKMALIIFRIILSIIYFVLVFPMGIIIKLVKKQKKDLNTNFIDYEETNLKNKRGILNALQILRLFTNEKYILMLPLIILLVLIGILLFFAQSTIVTPFIYTIF